MGLESDVHHKSEVQVSGSYKILPCQSPPQTILIEHCCMMAPGNEWHIEVKCRPILHKINGESQQRNIWRSLKEAYPETIVEEKHNDIEVTLPSLQDDMEIAAFGRPGRDDQKRMQMAVFAKPPIQGRNWKIWVHLVDDTITACKSICQKEDERENRLLTPLSGMFVSNTNEDITIELSSLEPGWKIIRSNVKTIKSSDAWNSPENSTDFPSCYFDLSHVNNTEHSFFCKIRASQEGDSARAEIVACFERERGREVIQPSKDIRKLDNACDYMSEEVNTTIPKFFFVLSFLFALFHPTGSTETTVTAPFYAREGCTKRKPLEACTSMNLNSTV